MWLSWAAFENQFRIGTLWCRWRSPSSGASNTWDDHWAWTIHSWMTFDALANGSWPTCHWKLQWNDNDMVSWKWVLDNGQLLVQINTSSYRYTDLPAEKRERDTGQRTGQQISSPVCWSAMSHMHCLYEWCGRADGWMTCVWWHACDGLI